MNVKEFLAHFKDDLPVGTFDNYDGYLGWHDVFYKKTLPFHRSIKQSYFELENRVVDNSYSYHEDADDLRAFAYLGLFTGDDEIEFSNLIAKITTNLTQIDNEKDMRRALDYLYRLTDLIVHEAPRGEKLSNALKDLRGKVIETKELDTEGTGELVIRFIDLIV